MRDDHLYRVLDKDTWMIDIIRAIRKMPLDHLDKNSQKKIISECRKYFWDAPYLFKLGNDGVMRRCVPREERVEILRKCHSAMERLATFRLSWNIKPIRRLKR
jgi:hypothetical protein